MDIKLSRVLHPNGTTDISNWSLTKNLRSRVKIVKSSSLQLDSFKWKKIGFSLKPPSFPPASPSPRSDLHVLLDPEIPIPKTTAPALPRLQPHEFEVRQFLHCYPQSLSSFPPRCSSFQIDPRLLNWIFLKHWAQSSICETSKFMSSIHLSLTKNSLQNLPNGNVTWWLVLDLQKWQSPSHLDPPGGQAVGFIPGFPMGFLGWKLPPARIPRLRAKFWRH